MESQCRTLASRAVERYALLQENSEKSRRLLIALAGAPGSGKTTIATRIAALIATETTSQSSPRVVVVSMDGFHLSRAILDGMPNREEAYIRRGAPWTFDAEAAVALVKRCKSGIDEEIRAPSFDHSIKDPVEGGLVIPAGTEIVLFEGLYLLLDHGPWSPVGDLVDERWFVGVQPSVAKERVAARHVAAGIEPDLESGRRRVETNDEINGLLITQHSMKRDLVIHSIEERVRQS